MNGRHGLYIRELDIWIFWYIFKGHDLHSPASPYYTEKQSLEFLEFLEMAWEASIERVGFVNYMTFGLASRISPMSISPPLHFSNLGEPIASKVTQQNMTQHSRGILGDAHAYHNHIGREAVWSFLNLLKYAGIEWDGNTAEIFEEKLWYRNEAGEKQNLIAPQFDIKSNPELVKRRRAQWQWHVTVSHEYQVFVTKVGYAIEQAKLSLEKKYTRSYSALENPLMILENPPQAEAEPADKIQIEVVLQRRYVDNKVDFFAFL